MLGRSLRREAHALGMTAGQAAALRTIEKYPELGVRELAAREGMSAPAMTRYLDRMQNAGLVERRRSSVDGRRVELHVTARGRAALRSLRSRRTAWLAARLERLSPAELEAVEAAIEPLLGLVEEDPWSVPPRW
jgi:DNA-binding MarR family transcriptional regulator